MEVNQGQGQVSSQPQPSENGTFSRDAGASSTAEAPGFGSFFGIDAASSAQSAGQEQNASQQEQQAATTATAAQQQSATAPQPNMVEMSPEEKEQWLRWKGFIPTLEQSGLKGAEDVHARQAQEQRNKDLATAVTKFGTDRWEEYAALVQSEQMTYEAATQAWERDVKDAQRRFAIEDRFEQMEEKQRDLELTEAVSAPGLDALKATGTVGRDLTALLAYNAGVDFKQAATYVNDLIGSAEKRGYERALQEQAEKAKQYVPISGANGTPPDPAEQQRQQEQSTGKNWWNFFG